MESTLVVSRWQAWALQCALWNPRSWQLANRYLHVPFPRHSGVWFRSFGNSCFSKRETGVSCCLLLAFSELGRTSCSAWGSVAGWRFPLLFHWSHGNLWAWGLFSWPSASLLSWRAHQTSCGVWRTMCPCPRSLTSLQKHLALTTAVGHPCSCQGVIWEGSSLLLWPFWVWMVRGNCRGCLCWLGSVPQAWWLTFKAPQSSPTPGQKGQPKWEQSWFDDDDDWPFIEHLLYPSTMLNALNALLFLF